MNNKRNIPLMILCNLALVMSYTLCLTPAVQKVKEEAVTQEQVKYEEIVTEKEQVITQLQEEKQQLQTNVEQLQQDNSSLKIENEKLKKRPVTSRSAQPRISTANTNGWTTASVTAYCPCAKCCGKAGGKTASGTTPQAGRTIAASSQYPFGTKIEIEGYGIYTVEDRGGAIKGNKIDMFFNSHNEALRFGRKQLRIRVVK